MFILLFSLYFSELLIAPSMTKYKCLLETYFSHPNHVLYVAQMYSFAVEVVNMVLNIQGTNSTILRL